MIRKNYQKERTEADFRFGMARLREYSEQVALLDGKGAERAALFRKYDHQVDATLSLVQTTRDFRIFNFSIGQMTDVLPYVLVAPAYFAGVGSLGGLQQTAGAFSRVQGGFTVFLDLYETLAAYNAGPARYAAHLETGAPLPAETRRYIETLAQIPGETALPPAVLSGTRLFFPLQAIDPDATPAPSAGLFVPRSARGRETP